MPDRPKDATAGPKLWVILARAYASLAAFVEHDAAQQGLGLSDFMVLEALLHKGPMTISEIGEKVLLAAPSMTSAIDRLEKLSCVVRKTSPSDRRIRVIELTPHGRSFIADLYPRHARALEEIAGVLSQAEKISFAGHSRSWDWQQRRTSKSMPLPSHLRPAVQKTKRAADLKSIEAPLP